MATRIDLGDVSISVVKKDIKNIHLSVYPPSGTVRISAPQRVSLNTIRVYAISKLGWVRQQQKKLRAQEREPPREYIDRESHYVWGRRYLLKVTEKDAPPCVALTHSRIALQIRPGASDETKAAILDDWYRQQLKLAVPKLIAKWERHLGVRVGRFHVQRMKTRWGSCNTRAGSIRLNTELAKKPKECLDYIVLHEMVHLLEPTHNRRFVELMDRFMPKLKFYSDELNRLPVRRETWGY
jgi:predicted metal-dependent hydrolase